MFGMFSLEPISHRGEIIETCHKLHLYATPLLISLCALMTDTCTRLSFALLCLNSADMNFSLKYELFGIEGIPTGVVGYITISLSLSLSLRERMSVLSRSHIMSHTHTHTYIHYTQSDSFPLSHSISVQSIHSIQTKQRFEISISPFYFSLFAITYCHHPINFPFRFDSIRSVPDNHTIICSHRGCHTQRRDNSNKRYSILKEISRIPTCWMSKNTVHINKPIKLRLLFMSSPEGPLSSKAGQRWTW